jgi:hypothetical protein
VKGDDESPDKLADRLEKEADQLENRGDQLGDRVDEVRQDWKRKRGDPGVPGANPLRGEDDQEPAEDETSPEGRDAPPEREAGDGEAEQSG